MRAAAILAGSLAVLAIFAWWSDRDAVTATPGQTITAPYAGTGAFLPSIALDAVGNPTVAFIEAGNLKVLRCNDSACAGGDETAPTPTPCPSCRPDFSIGIDTDGDGTNDCSTKAGTDTCTLFPGALFQMYMYLNALPAGVIEYQGLRFVGGWSGVAPPEVDYYGCFGGGSATSSRFTFECIDLFGDPFSVTGLIAIAFFACPPEGGNATVGLLHGIDLTQLTMLDDTQLPEVDSGNETLQMDCSGKPFPTLPPTTPTSLPTQTPSTTPTPSITPTPSATPTVTPSPTQTPPPAATPTLAVPELIGDGDCDGTIGPVDAAWLLQFEAGLVDAIPCETNGDVNGDDELNALDAFLILQYVAGLIDSLPP